MDGFIDRRLWWSLCTATWRTAYARIREIGQQSQFGLSAVLASGRTAGCKGRPVCKIWADFRAFPCVNQLYLCNFTTNK